MYSAYRDSNNISGLSDFCQVWLPTDWQPGTNTPIVLLALGSGDNAQTISTMPDAHAFAKAVTDAGYGVALAFYGGTNQFGNSTARAQVGIVADFVQTHTNGFGTLTIGAGKIVTVGFSMGAMTMLNWVGNLTTPTNRVKAFVTVNGAVNVNSANPSVTSAINAAYSGSVNNATDDPTTMAANGKYAGLHGWVTYATNDTVVPHSDMTAFVASTGATEVSEGAVGHQWPNITLPAVVAAVLAACES